MSADRFLVTILCDDVRREEGNKLSYMGIYSADILLPSFPAQLPKLCFVMNLLSLGEIDAPRELRFVIYSDDKILAELAAPTPTIEAFKAARSIAEPTPEGEQMRASILMVAQVQGISFASPCVLKVRAYCDGEQIRGGQWKVKTVGAEGFQLPGQSPLGSGPVAVARNLPMNVPSA